MTDDLRTPAEAAEIAWRRMCLAIDRDASVDALRWIGIYAALSALARREPVVPGPASPRSTLPPVEKVESVFPDSLSTGPFPVPVARPVDEIRPRALGP